MTHYLSNFLLFNVFIDRQAHLRHTKIRNKQIFTDPCRNSQAEVEYANVLTLRSDKTIQDKEQ